MRWSSAMPFLVVSRLRGSAFQVPRALWVVLLASFLLVACQGRVATKVLAKDGVLDLRGHDFGRGGSVELRGEWAFYPGLLLGPGEAASLPPAPGFRTVPDLWRGDDAGGKSGQGAGTYRLRILLPPSAPDMAIRYKTVSTAFELDADGRTIAKVGVPAADKTAAVPRFRPGVAILPSRGGAVDLLVRVSNHEYRAGGLWRSFTLGPAGELFASKRAADIATYALAAAIIVMVINSLLLFMFRRQDRAHLWFALFGLSLAGRVMVTGEYLIQDFLPFLAFEPMVRLEYISVALPIPLLALFLAELFPAEAKRPLLLVIILPFVARLVFGVPFISLPLLTKSVYPFYALAVTAIFLMLFGILIPAIAHRREGSLAVLGGGIILMASFVNDSLYTAFLINTGNFLGFGLLGFIIIQSGILGRRFSRAFDRGEALQEELADANAKLEQENALYRLSQTRLESALAEKDLLLREVHHRVKNSLQIVSSTLGLQSHRTEDPAALEVYAMARSRIRAISLVHEKLYGLQSAEVLDLGDYASDLVAQLSDSFGAGSHGTRLTVESEPIKAAVDDCVDFGLILTELVANACKHTGKAGRPVTVAVRIRPEGGKVVLLVEDDGPGFPGGFDPAQTRTLGYRVVWSLAKKHGGEAAVLPGPGARVELKLAMGDIVSGGPATATPEEPAGKERE
jgi:two-component sensor histidine kinase/uncharacterized membrane protein